MKILLKDDQTTSTALVKSIGGAMIDAVAASAAVQHFQNQQFQGLDVCWTKKKIFIIFYFFSILVFCYSLALEKMLQQLLKKVVLELPLNTTQTLKKMKNNKRIAIFRKKKLKTVIQIIKLFFFLSFILFLRKMFMSWWLNLKIVQKQFGFQSFLFWFSRQH